MEKKENLDQIIENSRSISDIKDIDNNVVGYLKLIGENSYKRKGIYSVLTTLLYYKYLHPTQDVRKHRSKMDGGFSGRSFDTKNVTPILKRHNLPSMSESGWLTRSLEQPYQYTLDYGGKLPKLLKMPFLCSLDYVEKNPKRAKDMLRLLLNSVIGVASVNVVEIKPLDNPELLTIDGIIDALSKHFNTNYHTHNGAKLPVLAFYSLYKLLINEMNRYSGCELADLSSLTACDRTNKASGDVEIFKDGELFESIEIKLNKSIDSQIVRVVEEKIYKWNPNRYYILSVDGVLESDRTEIESIVDSVRENHGCQIIINGLVPTIKYYLRLIDDLSEFVSQYSSLIQSDSELQIVHKEKWNELLAEL